MTSIPSVFLCIEQDNLTGALRVIIEDESGSGFRLTGPKCNGNSTSLLRHEIFKTEADEIRSYLDRAIPLDQL